MTKRTKENLGFLLLGGALSILFMELMVLKRNTKIEHQAELINAYHQYWTVTQKELDLDDWIMDGWDLDNPAVHHYRTVEENLTNLLK